MKVPKLALMSSRQLAENGHNFLFVSHGISINALPPFQYSLDCPHLNMTRVKKNRVIRTDIVNMDKPQKITWYEDGPLQDTFYTQRSHQATLYENTSILCAALCDREDTNFITSVTD